MVPVRGLRFVARGVTSPRSMDAGNTSAVSVDRLVKLYKGVAAVDGISFRLPAGTITGLLGGNGAGKTTTIAMIMGLVTPTAGSVTVLGAQMPSERYRVLHRMNFESPYVDMPMRLTVRQNLSVFAQLYAVADIDGAHRRARRRSRSRRISRPAQRQALGRAEDAGVARQVSAQQAGSAAARRADRLARSRHRRLGARAARALPPRQPRHHVAGLAQHERGRALVRARHHHEARPYRGRRHARALACALRARDLGRSVSRRRARARRPAARWRNDSASTPASISRSTASPPWCGATGICCARPGRAFSI